VHRTRPLGSGGCGDRRGRVRIQETLGIVPELIEAGFVAKIVRLTAVLEMSDRLVWRDGHPADRVDDFFGGDEVLLRH